MHAMDDFKIRNDTQRDCEDDRKENCYVFFILHGIVLTSLEGRHYIL